MERKEFEIEIYAPKEKIWNVLWNDETYRKWTAPFGEGSYAETDWEEGSRVLFLTPNGNGMVSRINKNDPHNFMSIEHLGYVIEGVEDTTSEEVAQWKGALENYTLEMVNGKTQLLIETDIAEAYLDMFGEAWPKALQKVKELSEKQ